MPAPSAEGPSGSGPRSSASINDRRLRAACRLALEVVRARELADPPEPAPHALRKMLGFQRLSTTAYETIARAVDDDADLRLLVAHEADEAEVGRAGWLWLHRPESWATDPAWGSDEGGDGAALEVVSPPEVAKRSRPKARARVETELARQRREADEARDGLRVARKELAESRREVEAVRAETAELHSRLTELTEERNLAVRTAKTAEAELAETRRRLKLAKEAVIDAEAELAQLRSSDVADVADVAGSVERAAAPSPEPSGPTIDVAAASAGVAAAAAAATDLGEALARAANALEPTVGDGGQAPSTRAASIPAPAARRPVARRGRRPVHRAVPPLPPGIFHGTPEANRHLIFSGETMLVIDGYNLARTTWSDLSPREDRQRVVSLLERVQARSGGDVVVVFDGESGTVAPRHSRAIRVRFSATGVTADDHITELVGSLPLDLAVVVVSSDRAVMADAERHGAAVLTSPAFLAAAGR